METGGGCSESSRAPGSKEPKLQSYVPALPQGNLSKVRSIWAKPQVSGESGSLWGESQFVHGQRLACFSLLCLS